MGIRGYEYNQIRIHIIIDSQIPVYYTRGYPFNYLSHDRDGFYPRIPVDMGIFVTPAHNQHIRRFRKQKIQLEKVVTL